MLSAHKVGIIIPVLREGTKAGKDEVCCSQSGSRETEGAGPSDSGALPLTTVHLAFFPSTHGKVKKQKTGGGNILTQTGLAVQDDLGNTGPLFPQGDLNSLVALEDKVWNFEHS